MATALRSSRTWTYEEWLEHEEAASIRHELADGQLFAMAGGSQEHALLAVRVASLLDAALAGRPCFVFSSDLRVRVDDDTVFYPDVQVICREQSDNDDPVLVVEVLSESTEMWDRTGKFERYRRLKGLQHYLLVAQDREQLEHFQRNGDGTWQYRPVGPGETLHIDGLADLVVDDVYARVRALRAARP